MQFSIYVADVHNLQSIKIFEDKTVGFPGNICKLSINFLDSYGFGVRPLIWFNNTFILSQAELTGN